MYGSSYSGSYSLVLRLQYIRPFVVAAAAFNLAAGQQNFVLLGRELAIGNLCALSQARQKLHFIPCVLAVLAI
jgi:hypothetical protein